MLKYYLFINMLFLSCCFFLVYLNFIKDFFFNICYINNFVINDDFNWDNLLDIFISLVI